MSVKQYPFFPSTKTKLFLTAVFCLLLALFFSAYTEKKTPLQLTQSLCLENIKNFQSELDTLQRLAEAGATKQQVTDRFKKSRIAFKRIEFLLEYLDNNRYPFFNGVNAVEMDDGFDPNAKPEGLQVIESEIAADSVDYDRVVFLLKQLKYRTLAFYLLVKDAKLRDTYIFEAMRFHLIRLETQNLVSFDSPEIRNNTKEISASLKVLDEIISYYKEESSTPEIVKLKSKITAAIAYLNTKNFTTLDRLFFIKQYLQPMTKYLMAAQQKLNINYLEASGQLFRAVNLKAATIYDADFINTKFYAQDKYYKNNPLYTALGKKLFFDKRLSADESMSCSTCHQPSNFLTDKLPTSITNKLGEFNKRNTPTLLNAALQAAYFYDLSAVTMETQVNHVVINPLEFNHNYDSILVRIKADTEYVRLFAEAFPEFKDNAISIYGINMCIADFERQFVMLNSPFDKYMRGETTVIDPAVKRGFNLFMGKAQCGSCHFAPTFFGMVPPFYGVAEAEVLGLTKSFDTIHPMLDEDIGRFKNFEIDQFKNAIKTSTVRNAALTAPYMHNGGFKTLEEVVEFYNIGGGAGIGLDVPNQTLPDTRLHLSAQEKKDIITFMKALTDTPGFNKLIY